MSGERKDRLDGLCVIAVDNILREKKVKLKVEMKMKMKKKRFWS